VRHTESVRRLRRFCRAAKLAPTSSTIPIEVTGLSAKPVPQSHFSDVWSGTLEGRPVAIKALCLHEDERAKVKKVCSEPRGRRRALVMDAGVPARARGVAVSAPPNIVQCVGTSGQFHLSLVSEWMPGGIVATFLRNHPEHNRVDLARLFREPRHP
jgi:hypothetical protein